MNEFDDFFEFLWRAEPEKQHVWLVFLNWDTFFAFAKLLYHKVADRKYEYGKMAGHPMMAATILPGQIVVLIATKEQMPSQQSDPAPAGFAINLDKLNKRTLMLHDDVASGIIFK